MESKTIQRSGNSQTGKGKGNHGIPVTDAEVKQINRKIKECGTMTKAAIELGVSRDNLARLIVYKSASERIVNSIRENL